MRGGVDRLHRAEAVPQNADPLIAALVEQLDPRAEIEPTFIDAFVGGADRATRRRAVGLLHQRGRDLVVPTRVDE